MIDASHITGLILAGGRGSRMGGVDKGLQPHAGRTLAMHAMERLQPQVGRLAINANRNLDAYAAMGAPVWQDSLPDHPGPLAGLLIGLTRCETPYLVSVPCDAPCFPLDLVAQLAHALAHDDAELAIAATREIDGTLQTHPVFCLMRVDLSGSLQRFLHEGQRKVGLWTSKHRVAQVVFDDASAFANVNTAAELQALRDPV